MTTEKMSFATANKLDDATPPSTGLSCSVDMIKVSNFLISYGTCKPNKPHAGQSKTWRKTVWDIITYLYFSVLVVILHYDGYRFWTKRPSMLYLSSSALLSLLVSLLSSCFLLFSSFSLLFWLALLLFCVGAVKCE